MSYPSQQQQSVRDGLHNSAWSTDLFDCFYDIPTCCLTYWCPCITFGRIAEIADQGATSCEATGAIYFLLSLFLGCGCLFSCIYRTKMRKLYNLDESPCGDCLVHCCCESCALCQEYRELKTRGFDMSLGWRGNMGNQKGGVAMAPVIESGMKR
ncbi:protein PLANT CADMIUM RESISTANCE 2-like [Tripterygium wilfordii]|uniref:protein PLANT CADMIUM RESISTANCE 2-like n=1 Tax=Tripterygium wilfordii TaxID=458696 RepID=UPI0018F85E85|nr:protein PLANT CADMIUM RESISTANCE 2-like [Tripterygium wilfordii]XP_038697771.1 protein PLANT CADMIUM RESISTANCE 2-like [Tripterygium wilfordii]